MEYLIMKIKHIAPGLIFGLFLSGGLTGAVFASDCNPKKVDSQQDQTINTSSQPSTQATMDPVQPET